MATRVLTWNLQGRGRPDLDAVASVIAGFQPDVVALQEVQRRQAAHLSVAFGWEMAWRFKHWPVLAPAEGLAVLAPGPLESIAVRSLAWGAAFWSWRRRISVEAVTDSGGHRLSVVNTHLGAHVGDRERVRQLERALGAGRGGDRPDVVVGDLNVLPGSDVLAAAAERGFVDSWAVRRPDDPGSTNWEPGPRVRPPTQRLDYVLTRPGVGILDATVPVGDWERYAALSDHLPLVVTLDVGPG